LAQGGEVGHRLRATVKNTIPNIEGQLFSKIPYEITVLLPDQLKKKGTG